MNRRNFLKNTGLISAPLLLNGVSVFSQHTLIDPILSALSYSTSSCGKILVIIQMNGGNDGLNTVIPLDKYSILSTARANLMLPASSVLPLSGSNGATGLHPAMSGMRNLYDAGKLAVVQGVSYPNPNFSHFFAQDIWFSGYNPGGNTGWMGRAFDESLPNFPIGYPNASNPDPPAIQLSGANALSLLGTSFNYGYNSSNPASLINVINASPGSVPVSDYGNELAFLRLMKDQSNAYAGNITNAYNAQATQSTMYATSGNTLSDQLKIVARLIGGGLQTPVYIVNHPNSFDTHVNQVDTTDTTTGNHASMLSRLSEAISAFMDDVNLMGVGDKVSGMTYSEFGRRVISNNSVGTDHGTAAPVFVFGNAVNAGIYGTNANLPSTVNSNTQVPLQYDFRQIYKSVMMQTFCMTSTEAEVVLGGSYTELALFNSVPLPIQSIKLSGKLQNAEVALTFETLGNNDFNAYFIEFSEDGERFREMYTKARVGNDVAYTYKVDLSRNFSAIGYFRVKGILADGQTKYSNVLKLRANESNQVYSVYPIPVTNHTINIQFYEKPNRNVEIEIYTMSGNKLYYNQFQPETMLKFSVPDMFDADVLYILQMKVDGNEYAEKISFSR